MTTKLIPIVALVPEDTFRVLGDAVKEFGEPTPLLVETMERNGWTIDAIVAGSMITFSLRDAGAL